MSLGTCIADGVWDLEGWVKLINCSSGGSCPLSNGTRALDLEGRLKSTTSALTLVEWNEINILVDSLNFGRLKSIEGTGKQISINWGQAKWTCIGSVHFPCWRWLSEAGFRQYPNMDIMCRGCADHPKRVIYQALTSTTTWRMTLRLNYKTLCTTMQSRSGVISAAQLQVCSGRKYLLLL